jgi:predicted transcriptional regulator
MTTKEKAINTIKRLPEDATWEDIQERIFFIAGVEKGFKEIDEGKGIPHEKIKKELNSWISK